MLTGRKLFLLTLSALFFSGTPAVVHAQKYTGEVSRKSPLPRKDVEVIAPMTFDELRRFVRDWKRYSRWLKTDGKQYHAVAYLEPVETADYPDEVVRWMDERGWATDRFFLLERRIRETLSVLKMEEKRTNFTEHMQLQIISLQKDPTKTKAEKKALEEQYLKSVENVVQSMNYVPPVSPEELELIKLNRKALEAVMEP